MNSIDAREESSCQEPLLLSSFRVALSNLYSLHVTAINNTSITTTQLHTSTNLQHPQHSPSQPFSIQQQQPHDTHDFLIQFQSRNVRRKIESHLQSQQESSKKRNEANPTPTPRGTPIEPQDKDGGSSMYASMALLYHPNYEFISSLLHLSSSSAATPQQIQQHISSTMNIKFIAHEAEKLFSSQTMLHRIRRMNMIGAIDWEIESSHRHLNGSTDNNNILNSNHHQQLQDNKNIPVEASIMMGVLELLQHSPSSHIQSNQYGQVWTTFIQCHGERISSFHPALLRPLLGQYYQEQSSALQPQQTNNHARIITDPEEEIKGEMMLLTVASMLYYTTFVHFVEIQLIDDQIAWNHDKRTIRGQNSIGPLLQSLSSTMAVIAFRLLYTPSSISTRQNKSHGHTTTPSSTPIISTVLQALEKVHNVAMSLPIQELLHPSMCSFLEQQHLPINNNNNNNSNTPTNHSTCTALQLIQAQDKNQHHFDTLNRCVCETLSSIPDSLLGSPGGAREKLSIDPRCLQAASVEMMTLSTGIGIVQNVIVHMLERIRSLEQEQQEVNHHHTTQQQSDKRGISAIVEYLLVACEQWAKFVPLSMEFIELMVPIASQFLMQSAAASNSNDHSSSQDLMIVNGLPPAMRAAFAFLIQIFSPRQEFQLNKGNISRQRRRQRKKGQQKNGHAPPTINNEEIELRLQHDIACRAAILSWECIHTYGIKTLEYLMSSTHVNVDGEGPVGCLCACTSACIPHLIQHHHHETCTNSTPNDESESSLFFSQLMQDFKKICCSPNITVRALSYEHITAIHTALIKRMKGDGHSIPHLTELDLAAIHNISECVLALASRCAYPPGYFDDMTLNSIEELEMERNDVRDLLRAVTNFEEQKSGNQSGQFMVSLKILTILLSQCRESLMNCGNDASSIPPETVVHAFSSLAKPLNYIAKLISANGNLGGMDQNLVRTIIQDCLLCFHTTCSSILNGFAANVPMKSIFPSARLCCISIASFAPFFSFLSTSISSIPRHGVLSDEIVLQYEQSLGLVVMVAARSSELIPELTVKSTLDSTIYDIRGAMRSPGGEDHMGCLALSRCGSESDALAVAALQASVSVMGDSTNVVSIIIDLCRIHDALHKAELDRGPGIFHGTGVLPMSRRLFLQGIAIMGLAQINKGSEYMDQIMNELQRLFQTPLLVAARTNEREDITDAEKLYILCEITFDLSFFPSQLSATLFSHGQDPIAIKGLETIFGACISGYNLLSTAHSDPNEAIIQWGRLRGAILSLFRGSSNPGLSQLAAQSIIALNSAECKAATIQCRAGPNSNSSIFNEVVIGNDDSVPAGVFIIILRDILEKVIKSVRQLDNDGIFSATDGCVAALHSSKDSIFSLLTMSNPSPENDSYVDPRETIAESWFFAIASLITLKELSSSAVNDALFQQLVSETLVICMQFLFMKQLDKEKSTSIGGIGVSLDHPLTLSMMKFMEKALSGCSRSNILALVGQILEPQLLNQLDPNSIIVQGPNMNPEMLGKSLFCAAMYRGISGTLPPWAIECTPSLYEAFYSTCGNRIDNFCLSLRIGASLKRLLNTAPTDSSESIFCCINPGVHLAGSTIRADFFTQTEEICSKDDNEKWRKFKGILKAACGGKKKATSFNLKPSLTNWECKRI